MWAMSHSKPGGNDSLGLNESFVVFSGDGWTRESVFEYGRCHQGVRQSGGSCVLILFSFWLDLAHREDAEGRFRVCVSQHGMRLPV